MPTAILGPSERVHSNANDDELEFKGGFAVDCCQTSVQKILNASLFASCGSGGNGKH